MKVEDWSSALAASVTRVANVIFEYLPSVIGSVALLAIGWLVARLLRSASRHVAERALERLSRERLARTKAIGAKTQQSRAYQSVPAVISGIVYWTVLLFFLAAAIEALGLPAVSNVLGLVTAYLPKVLAGVLIVFVGLWAGEFLRALLSRAAARAEFAYAELLGRMAQVLVVLVFLIIAIDQLGIDSTVLIVTMSTGFAATFGAAALAFGLGARDTVGNIIAARYVRRNYHAGDLVRIGDLEGRIIEVADTAVMLESNDGRVMVPAAKFNQEVSVLLAKG